MTLVTPAQNAFTSGEWSPRLFGRADLQKYGAACAILENLVIMPHGAVQRRPGTAFVGRALSGTVVLIPFVFNVEQAYVLELTPGRLRLFRDGGAVSGPDGEDLLLDTPWNGADLAALSWTQSADTMYLTCGRVRPHVLTRPGPDSFTLAPAQFTGQPADWKDGSWPACATFHQQRLWFAGTPGKPQSLWASKTGQFTDFTTGTDDAAGLALTLASSEVNAIRWLVSARALLVGTSGGEWVVSGSALDGPITSKTLAARRNSNYGTAAVPPLLVGTAVIHASGDRRRLHELGYSFADDGYVSTDLSLLGEHITKARIRRIAHAPDPDGLIWCVMDDGTLAGCTYLRGQDVVGWHRHPTQGRVLSVAVIPEEAGSEVWLAVDRGGVTCIESLRPTWDGESTDEDGCWFVDAGLLYTGEPVSVVAGLEHLEGREVTVLADGATHPPRQVRDGRVELVAPARRVLAGLPVTWRLAPMPLDAGSARGSAQGKRKRVCRLMVRVYKTLGLRYGLPGGAVYAVPDRDVTAAMDGPPTPWTGDAALPLPENWSLDGRFEISGGDGLPATVIMIVPEVLSYE